MIYKIRPCFRRGNLYSLSFVLFRLPFLPRKSRCLRAAFAVPDLPLAMNASGSHRAARQVLIPFFPVLPFFLSPPFFVFLLLCDYIITYYISFVNTFLIFCKIFFISFSSPQMHNTENPVSAPGDGVLPPFFILHFFLYQQYPSSSPQSSTVSHVPFGSV